MTLRNGQTPRRPERPAASPRRMAATLLPARLLPARLLLLALLVTGGCAGLVPVRVDPRIELVQVEHWLDKKEQGRGRIETVADGPQPVFTYADPVLNARISAQANQVEVLLENRTDTELVIDWERSYLLDEANVASSLFVRPGSATMLTPKDEKPRVLLPNTKLDLRIAKHAGDSAAIGDTKALFPILRRNAETARADVKANVGKVRRLVLTLKLDGERHIYHFHLRLVDARVDGQPVMGQ